MRTYEKYKDSGISWIGKVPDGWERIRIKYGLRQSIAGVWGDEKKNDKNDVICYRMADFNYDKGILNLDNVTYRNILPQQLAGRTVRKGDLILEKSGGGDLYPVGRVVRVNSDQKATCSNFAHTIATNSNISSNFLYYYFFNLYSKGVSRLFFNQTTGIQNLKVGDYLSQDMYAPSKSEQEAIANYLDKKTAEIDKIIAEREKKIELLNELKSSIISRAVTKGINPHAKMKDSGIDWIGEIPEGWEVCRLSFFVTIKSGDMLDRSLIKDSNIYAVFGGGEKIGYTNNYNVIPPAIIIGRVGARCGCVTKVWNKCWATDNALILHTKLDNDYCYYLLSACKLNNLNTSSAQPLITATKVKDIRLPIPSLKQQYEIVSYIKNNSECIDKMILNAFSEISLLREYKQSLISEVVTGKRKVID